MRAIKRGASSPDPFDQRVRLHGVSWADYERLLEIRGESSGTRMTYLNGELELMTPSWDHEIHKTTLGRLIEAWSDHQGIDLVGGGSWTIKSELKQRGAEPDECYVVGATKPEDQLVPDFACEVIWTSGGIDKLDVYAALGVPEVWFFEKGKLRFYILGRGHYVRATRSRVLRTLDPALIETCMKEESQPAAVRKLRAALSRPTRRKKR